MTGRVILHPHLVGTGFTGDYHETRAAAGRPCFDLQKVEKLQNENNFLNHAMHIGTHCSTFG